MCALPYKPTRTFTGTVGVASTGVNGPESIKTDTNEIVAMFDPLATHGDGTPGGIALGNMATGEFTATPTANKGVLYDSGGNLPGSIANAVNVTTNINGNAISSIFESNGTTVKNATSATNATNATSANKIIETGSGGLNVFCKKIDIGAWNMYTTITKTIAHGLGSSWSKVVSVNAMIFTDLQTQMFTLNRAGDGGYSGYDLIDSTNIVLVIKSGGYFNTVAYQSTLINRGYLLIEYTD